MKVPGLPTEFANPIRVLIADPNIPEDVAVLFRLKDRQAVALLRDIADEGESVA